MKKNLFVLVSLLLVCMLCLTSMTACSGDPQETDGPTGPAVSDSVTSGDPDGATTTSGGQETTAPETTVSEEETDRPQAPGKDYSKEY